MTALARGAHPRRRPVRLTRRGRTLVAVAGWAGFLVALTAAVALLWLIA